MDQPQEPQLPNRVDITHLLSKVANTQYAVLPNSTVTLCVLYLKNGHVIVGKSACVDPGSFNQAEGEKYAFEDALNELWPLEGYLLQEDRHRAAEAALATLNKAAQ